MTADDRTGLLEALLEGAHLAVPDDVPALVVKHAKQIDAIDVAIYLVDYEEETLRPVPNPQSKAREPFAIDGTIGGRSFQRIDLEHTPSSGDQLTVWAPVLDGTERLGVLEVIFPSDGVDRDLAVKTLAGLVAELVMTKSHYGDLFERVRRTRPMSFNAELIWKLLPPRTFANTRLAIAATLAPPYELGGDAFDYAVDDTTAHVAIFDAMGHELRAGILATIALAAYRNNRRNGRDLEETVANVDAAIASEYSDSSFVTGVFTELDTRTGRLRYCLAGHPKPLVLRHGRIVMELNGGINGGPLGLGTREWCAGEEVLEPGDRVIMFTDGVVEARSSDGTFFGDARLADFIVRASGEGAPPPETLRRLLRAILDHQEGHLQDDATVVIIEWRGPGPEHMVIGGSGSAVERPWIDEGRKAFAARTVLPGS